MKRTGKIPMMLLQAMAFIFLMTVFHTVSAQKNHFSLVKELPKKLKEISGLAKDGNGLWSIIDSKDGDIYKLDLSGKIIQQIHLTNYKLKDAEAVTADRNYVYVGDIGDNNGSRKDRTIIRIRKSSLDNKEYITTEGEAIHFTFPDEERVKKKKSNNFDCEALISYKDSLFVFTKRRDDMKTGLYALPKQPGTFSARNIAVFKAKGLITDASVNQKENEVALIGYDQGHTRAFIWILSNFKGNDFFSGNFKRYELTNQKKLDWQLESITYKDDNSFFIACEKSKDLANTLYIIDKANLIPSRKGDSK